MRKAVSSDFKNEGDSIYILGETHQELGASELAFMLREDGEGGIGGSVPGIDTSRNLAMYRALTHAMSDSLVASAHDCSDGGLAVALAECCFGSDSGASIELNPILSDPKALDKWGALFGESLGRIIVSVKQENREAFESVMRGNACHYIGTVEEGDEISFSIRGEKVLVASMNDLRTTWKHALDGGGA